MTGSPGTGKTTLGSQLAFHHAATRDRVVVATLLSETHDLMFAKLRGFRFFDPALVGDRVHYLNLFDALAEEGLDDVVTSIRRVMRKLIDTLLIIDLEGANLGKRGLIAGFHETEPDLISQAEGIGLDLQGAVESGLIRILWNPPLETRS